MHACHCTIITMLWCYFNTGLDRLQVKSAIHVVLSCHVILSKSIKIRQFEIKNSKNFWGGGTAPSQTPPHWGGGHPLPSLPPRRLRRLVCLGSRLRRSCLLAPPCPPLTLPCPPGADFLDPPMVKIEPGHTNESTCSISRCQ